jgi:hypothetical protein
MVFNADVTGAAAGMRLTYKWGLSLGRILDGQGTSTLRVVYDHKRGYSDIATTANLAVDGLPAGCPNTVSCTVRRSSVPLPQVTPAITPEITRIVPAYQGVVTICPQDESKNTPRDGRLLLVIQGTNLDNPNYEIEFAAESGKVIPRGKTSVYWDLSGEKPGITYFFKAQLVKRSEPSERLEPAIYSTMVKGCDDPTTSSNPSITQSGEVMMPMRISFEDEQAKPVNLDSTNMTIRLTPLFDADPKWAANLTQTFRPKSRSVNSPRPKYEAIFNKLHLGQYSLSVDSPNFEKFTTTIEVNEKSPEVLRINLRRRVRSIPRR